MRADPCISLLPCEQPAATLKSARCPAEVLMTIKRMTKTDVPRSFGAFKPVGHVVTAFENDEQATKAAEALREKGFKDEDILQYSAVEEAEQMKDLLGHASGFAEFGHEIALMRKYRELASEGCGWLIVYAPRGGGRRARGRGRAPLRRTACRKVPPPGRRRPAVTARGAQRRRFALTRTGRRCPWGARRRGGGTRRALPCARVACAADNPAG